VFQHRPKRRNRPVAADAPAKPLIATMTSEQFQKVIQAMGFECTRAKTDGKDDSFFTFRAEGYKVAAFFHDASYLELYNAFTDVNPTLATVNEWNQKNSFSRAYVDKDGNAVLENDFILTGGVSSDSVELFVKTFRGFCRALGPFRPGAQEIAILRTRAVQQGPVDAGP
jgi:Putative bacterial sensory transduction regulator